MVPGDTLPEVPSDVVQAGVTSAAASIGRAYEATPSCTRYFRQNSMYVVVLRMTCRAGVVTDDGEQLAAFDLSGAQIGRTLASLTSLDYVALVPEVREH